MRSWGVLFVVTAVGASLGCVGNEAEPPGPRGLTQADVGVPRERAEKVLKVLESANAHNDRLHQMDQELFADDTQ